VPQENDNKSDEKNNKSCQQNIKSLKNREKNLYKKVWKVGFEEYSALRHFND